MNDCSRCKFCDMDYIFDPEAGDEFPFYTCEKGNDTDLDFECKDFEEYKPKPYKEKDTKCDNCEYLIWCKLKGNYIDCTTVDDKRSHVLCSKENCKKRG